MWNETFDNINSGLRISETRYAEMILVLNSLFWGNMKNFWKKNYLHKFNEKLYITKSII